MHPKIVQKYHDEAEINGLILIMNPGKVFCLSVNSGEIDVPRNPEKIFELVLLAQKHSNFRKIGEHACLLQLVTEKKRLASKSLRVIRWVRPHHVDMSSNPEEWISLKEYLINNGIKVNEVLSKEKSLQAKTNTDEKMATCIGCGNEKHEIHFKNGYCNQCQQKGLHEKNKVFSPSFLVIMYFIVFTLVMYSSIFNTTPVNP